MDTDFRGAKMTSAVLRNLGVKTSASLEGTDFSGADLSGASFDNISAEAWQAWLGHQTMLINENRLSPINPEHRKFLVGEMEKYLFGAGSAAPEGYVPE